MIWLDLGLLAFGHGVRVGQRCYGPEGAWFGIAPGVYVRTSFQPYGVSQRVRRRRRARITLSLLRSRT